MLNNIPLNNAVYSDCQTDEERYNFFLLGRGYETGIVAKAIQNDIAMAFKFRSEVQKERSNAL
jgi:hypothetical protein